MQSSDNIPLEPLSSSASANTIPNVYQALDGNENRGNAPTEGITTLDAVDEIEPQAQARDPVSAEGSGPPRPSKTEERPALFQIPAYQGHGYVDRSYNYTLKYPADPKGTELDSGARVWKVYLDESESYDNDMVKSFRDTIDALLVFAALFSAVVTGFVVETSQALEPNYAQINVNLLFEQNQLIRAAGNASQMERIPKSPLGPDSVTHSDRDIWVNFMFFTSLSLSLATALLAILIKQWLQAFTTLIPGDARERSLIRQFRFTGLEKWKLREIINILPLFLHLALGLFLIGLSGFVYDFHTSIRCAVISIAGMCFAFYFTTAALPAIWLDCPYRQPIWYIPVRVLRHPFQIVRFIFLVIRYALAWRLYHSRWNLSVMRCLPQSWLKEVPHPSFSSSPLLVRERRYVNETVHWLEASSLSWLFIQTPNVSVQHITFQSVTRFLQVHLNSPDAREFQCLPLKAMSLAAVQSLSTAPEKMQGVQILHDFIIKASHVGPDVLPPPSEMWRLAVQSSHLQFFVDNKLLPMDVKYSERYTGLGPLGLWHPRIGGIDINAYGLTHACYQFKWNAVKALIPHVPNSHLIDYDSFGDTVLGFISSLPRIDNVSQFSNILELDPGFNSISLGDWAAILQSIMGRGIDINMHCARRYGPRVLHLICQYQRVDAVRYLCSQIDNVDCNIRDESGLTPLHYTAWHSSSQSHEIVDILIQHGADVGARCSRGETALQLACQWTLYPDVIRALCSTMTRESINHRNEDGNTALHFTLSDLGSRPEVPQIVQLLLSAGGDPNIANELGEIPLHSACQSAEYLEGSDWSQFTKGIQELLTRTDKDKVNALSHGGKTPLDMLVSVRGEGEGCEAILRWMRENGAKLASELNSENS